MTGVQTCALPIYLVFRFAERITVMVSGAVFATGSPGEIGADAAVRAVYLGRAGHG